MSDSTRVLDETLSRLSGAHSEDPQTRNPTQSLGPKDSDDSLLEVSVYLDGSREAVKIPSFQLLTVSFPVSTA